MHPQNETVVDYITGKTKPDTGAEANRQKVERRLVEEKGYAKSEIEVDAGNYIAAFSDIEGYEAPASMEFTVGKGQVVGIAPEYIKIGWPTWAKVGLILGGSAIAVGGGVALVKALPRALPRRET